MEREDLKSIVESLLFVADGPVTLQRLEEVLEGASKEDIRSVLDELQRELDTQRRGVRLVEVAGGFQLREQHLQLVESGHALVVADDQVGQFLSDLLPNRLVLGGFFRSQPPVAGNALHGRCLLGTS